MFSPRDHLDVQFPDVDEIDDEIMPDTPAISINHSDLGAERSRMISRKSASRAGGSIRSWICFSFQATSVIVGIEPMTSVH